MKSNKQLWAERNARGETKFDVSTKGAVAFATAEIDRNRERFDEQVERDNRRHGIKTAQDAKLAEAEAAPVEKEVAADVKADAKADAPKADAKAEHEKVN